MQNLHDRCSRRRINAGRRARGCHVFDESRFICPRRFGRDKVAQRLTDLFSAAGQLCKCTDDCWCGGCCTRAPKNWTERLFVVQLPSTPAATLQLRRRNDFRSRRSAFAKIKFLSSTRTSRVWKRRAEYLGAQRQTQRATADCVHLFDEEILSPQVNVERAQIFGDKKMRIFFCLVSSRNVGRGEGERR